MFQQNFRQLKHETSSSPDDSYAVIDYVMRYVTHNMS